jgi:hypothetical protein
VTDITGPTRTDLLDSLRDANPVHLDQLPAASLARIRAVVLDDNAPSATGQARQPTLVWRGQLVGIGAVIAIVAMVATLAWIAQSLGVAPVSSSKGGVATSGSDSGASVPGSKGPAPSSSDIAGNASCVYLYSLERLTDREWAFDGTVTEMVGDQVSFHVNEWFRGSENSLVTLTGNTSWEDGPALSVGQRYLVAGADRSVWGCGFTQPYDPAVAAEWRDALGRSLPSPSPAAVAPARPLTVAELSRLLAGDRSAMAGRELVVSGRLEVEPTPCPPGGPVCPPVVLVGLQPSLTLQPVADLGASNWPDVGRPLDGTFAMAFVDAVLRYHGTVSLARDGGPWTPGTVPAAVAGTPQATDFVLVHGWLGAGGVMICPTQLPLPSGQLDYGCGSRSWLTDDPWPAGGVSNQPHTDPIQGLWVQNDAYDDFALDPVRASAGASARLGTFLVRWSYVNPCPAAGGVIFDCYVPPSAWHWQLVYRIDPWPGT